MPQNNTLKKYNDLIAACDLLIKAGKVSSVFPLISKLNISRVPRDCRQGLAKICRRAGLIDQGLQLLYPVIRNKKQIERSVTAGEISEYAVLLSRNGLIQEAMVLLSSVDFRQAPEAKLYQAYCCISTWEYENAIFFLKDYLDLNVDGYSKLIAQVNLASSYLALEQLDMAEQQLAEVISQAQKMEATRLIGNSLELRAQIHLARGNFSKSRDDLNQALSIFSQGYSYDQLLIYKWQSITDAFEQNSVTILNDFRNEALKRNHWESVREADLFSIKLKFDQKRFDHLVIGTPMEGYRRRIQRQIEGHQPNECFLFGRSGSLELDLSTGRLKNADDLNAGKKIHQMIAALVTDFYVPRNMGTLFSELYPNEHFDINSSSFRMHQILRRTRRWLESNKIPASIEHSCGNYRLDIHGDFCINVPLRRSAIEAHSLKWQELKTCFPLGVKFTAQEACDKLNLSRSGFHRLAEWATNMGELIKSGSGKSTVHEVASALKR